MTFNEFNRELEKRIPDPNLRYMLGVIFEHQVFLAKNLDSMASVTVQMADQLQRFANLNKGTMDEIAKLKRGGREAGVEVESESIIDDPEKERH